MTEATGSDRRILVQISGPGCAPCVLLSRYLDREAELVSQDYVYLKLDTRMPGARAIYKRLRDGDQAGVPWMAILDASGAVLITSDRDPAEEASTNIGYPGSATGIAHWRHMLETTRQRLSDRELATLIDHLE